MVLSVDTTTIFIHFTSKCNPTIRLPIFVCKAVSWLCDVVPSDYSGQMCVVGVWSTYYFPFQIAYCFAVCGVLAGLLIELLCLMYIVLCVSSLSY